MAILNPEKVGNITGTWTPEVTMPTEVKALGVWPNEKNLLHGDLLLVSALRPNKIQTAIIQAQKKGGCEALSAKWHHAAIYLGASELLEAVWPGGVQIIKLHDYVAGNELLFRRDQKLTDYQRTSLCINGMRHLKTGYSVRDFIRVWLQSDHGFWRTKPSLARSRGYICSQLYSEAYKSATGKLLVDNNLGIVLPAYLSEIDRLSDVEVGYSKLIPTPSVTRV